MGRQYGREGVCAFIGLASELKVDGIELVTVGRGGLASYDATDEGVTLDLKLAASLEASLGE